MSCQDPFPNKLMCSMVAVEQYLMEGWHGVGEGGKEETRRPYATV